ncbi:MAG: hypothetical protein A2341_18675 [Deltaproteobacteria bacterium RIFOXYB12_FULL_58_9]|nr:MAG: hypothetical protein A2341_18675 [Deltaproteobacteria bacterium RIFOXYB12_FULL_58_9]
MKALQTFILAITVFALGFGCSKEDAKKKAEPDPDPVPAAASAKVFFPAPDPMGVNLEDLIDVELGDVIEAFPGGYLRGYHFQTENCCKKYSCADGAVTCEADLRVCADDDDANAITSVVPVPIPTSMIPFDLSTIGFTGDTLHLETVFCTGKPRMISQVSGWMATPVDVPRSVSDSEGLRSETDAFAEVQVYHATQTYFEHIRSLLGPEFCLRGSSMKCNTDGTAVLDANGQPELSFHIATNLLMPKIDQSSLATIGQQVAFLGRGASADNPVLIEDYARLDNAAFIPSMEGDPSDVPPELAILLDMVTRPYDFNVYFQGNRDFAYDGDVVFHEFTHAVIYTLAPSLHSLGVDVWGSHAEPGSMNEGWSDYFAASFTDSSVTGEYSGEGIRDADNDDACPSSIVGEVHQDSLPWSGALWDMRKAVMNNLGALGVDALDQLLLATIALSDNDETMARQAGRIIDLIGLDDTLSDYADDATSAFAAHGVTGCERVRALSIVGVDGSVALDTVAWLQQPGPSSVGLSNMAPSVAQLRIEVPDGTPGFTLSWHQGAGGIFGMGGEAAPPGVLVHEDGPIAWNYNGGQASPRNTNGDILPFDPTDTANQPVLGTPDANGEATADFTVALTPECTVRTFFVSLASTDSDITLKDIEVVLDAQEICP